MRQMRLITFVHVDDVEDHALVLFAVVDGEVEPEAMTRIARIGSEAKVILKLTDQ